MIIRTGLPIEIYNPYAPWCCLLYKEPTKLGDFGQVQMLGFIFQHHGKHIRAINNYMTIWTRNSIDRFSMILMGSWSSFAAKCQWEFQDPIDWRYRFHI